MTYKRPAGLEYENPPFSIPAKESVVHKATITRILNGMHRNGVSIATLNTYAFPHREATNYIQGALAYENVPYPNILITMAAAAGVSRHELFEGISRRQQCLHFLNLKLRNNLHAWVIVQPMLAMLDVDEEQVFFTLWGDLQEELNKDNWYQIALETHNLSTEE